MARTRAELHFHLLPGVDDGPRTLDESIALARSAVADGTGFVVCTPHSEQVDVVTVPDRVHEVRAALAADQIALEITSGGEIRAGTSLTDAELEILAQGPPGRRWVLLEAPLEPHRIGEFHAHADELEDRGYGLLIAHPERCAPLVGPGGGLEHRIRGGAQLQVNASSLTGAHDERSRVAGFDLLERGLVTALASDAHGVARPPLLSAAARLLTPRGIADEPLTVDGPWWLLRAGMSAARDRPAA